MREAGSQPPDRLAADAVEEAFTEFVLRYEAHHQVEMESLCDKFPSAATVIRERWEDWQRVAEILDGLGAVAPLSSWMRSVRLDVRDPGISLHEVDIGSDESGAEPPATALLERLATRKHPRHPYRVCGEVARGGMGAILRVWDEDLRRNLAMKVALGRRSSSSSGPRSPADQGVLERFLEEAQITSQLDHPGIVPVHELGVDPDGHIYFTMPLVKGRDFKAILGLLAEGREEWTLTRAVGVMIKVCQAVAFAHSKGVVHRDLKPANVMVGRFGETYVMDWGLAKVLGRKEQTKTRAPRPEDSFPSVIDTDRQAFRDSTPDSPLVTRDGHILGTPAYMAPEQAEGKLEEIGPRSDVYSLGAMLYQTLTGQMPYVPPGTKLPPSVVHGKVLHGPPERIEKLAPESPPELVAICEKAMARRPERRYADAMEMAADLERYLERRPVTALSSKPGYLMRLFFERNRRMASTVAAALVVVIVLTVFFISHLQTAVEETRSALDQKQVAFDRLEAPSLLSEAQELYPLLPETVPRMDAWLGRVDDLLARRGERTDPEVSVGVEGESPEVAAREDPGTPASSEAPRVPASFDIQLERLAMTRAEVSRHRKTALDLPRISLEEAADAWDEAMADIVDLEVYGGEEIAPQLGLSPLGWNPQSGLWEFWHVTSGTRPPFDEDRDGARLEESSGIVLVLIPGGSYLMGSPEDDPERESNERQHRVALKPFFLSKYELTQSQWLRIMGYNPSGLPPGGSKAPDVTFMHPVETITWHEASRCAWRLDLALPTEAQWEYAARGGTSGAFYRGDERESLEGWENLMDRSFQAPQPFTVTAPWNDKYVYHAPVGTFRPNPYGLFDVLGNVAEWCADLDVPEYPADSTEPGDGSMPGGDSNRRAFRGGSWYHPPRFARVAFRQFDYPKGANFARGLRLARAVRP